MWRPSRAAGLERTQRQVKLRPEAEETALLQEAEVLFPVLAFDPSDLRQNSVLKLVVH